MRKNNPDPEPFTGSAAAYALFAAVLTLILGVALLARSVTAVMISIAVVLFTAVVLAMIANGERGRKP